MFFLYIPFLALAIFCKLLFWARISYRQRASLKTVPGPRWAAFSRLWLVRTLASGKSCDVFVDTNRRYGSLARIGPKNLMTSDPDVIRRILAARSGYSRGPWFDSLKIDPNVSHIVSERDEKKHNRLKYKLSASFTSKSMGNIEPVIDERLVDWLRRAHQSWTSDPHNYTAFDIGRRIQYLTVDIITQVCLGKELGCVSSDSDKYDFLSIVQQGNAVCQHFSVILEINTVMSWIAKIPLLGGLVIPGPSDKTGVGRIMGIIEGAVEHRQAHNYEKSSAVLHQILDKGVSEEQANADLVVALVAGSDTTSTSVQSTLVAITTNPLVYQELKSEIHNAVASNMVSYPIRQAEAKQLPYLQACVFEGLRKFPPLSQLRERVVPSEGDMINGHRIPGGTYIGFNIWGAQLDKVFGDDPDVFRPERWLIDDQERLTAMRETLELIFGHGATKCLGMPMAMMELNKVIFELLRNFDITIANPYQPWTSVCHGIFHLENLNVFLTPSAEGGKMTC